MNMNFDQLMDNKEKAFLYKSLLASKEAAETGFNEAMACWNKINDGKYLQAANEFKWCKDHYQKLIDKIFDNTLVHDSVFLHEIFVKEQQLIFYKQLNPAKVGP